MNVDPIEILPPELLDAGKWLAVIEHLRKLPVSVAIKRTTYLRWCSLVGRVAEAWELQRVQRDSSS